MNAMYLGTLLPMSSTLTYPALRGRHSIAALAVLSRQSLSTDSVGTTTVTFAGVQANSEIRVYLPGGTEVAGAETCAADHVLVWPVYAPGSANNTVTIRIVHTAYKIKEFNYTAAAGVASLPVQQERDPWYSNP